MSTGLFAEVVPALAPPVLRGLSRGDRPPVDHVLPATDEDIKEAGAHDAGDYLITLQARDLAAYTSFLKERKQTWNREPRQMVHRCIDHLMGFITHTIASNTQIKHAGRTTHGSDEVEPEGEAHRTVRICSLEAKQFMQKRRAGQVLQRKLSSSAMDSDIVKLMARTRQRLEALMKSPSFRRCSRRSSPRSVMRCVSNSSQARWSSSRMT